MANLNKVMLMGNLTRDPELTYLPSQTAAVRFGLAINRSWTGQDGVKKEETTFVDCEGFGKVAELIAKYKKKGDPLFVEGRLKLDQWEGQDGSKKSKLKVIVENFQFLNRAGAPVGGGGNFEADETGDNAPDPRRQRPWRGSRIAPKAARRRNRPHGPAPQNVEADPPSMEEEAPPIKDDEIPF